VIIHSIAPLEFLQEQPQLPQATMRQINGGYLEGQDTPQGFQATRLCSTNPALYLKTEYAPGSILLPQTHS